jgi:hypothetical protein
MLMLVSKGVIDLQVASNGSYSIRIFMFVVWASHVVWVYSKCQLLEGRTWQLFRRSVSRYRASLRLCCSQKHPAEPRDKHGA